MDDLGWSEQRIRDVLIRNDDLELALAATRDVVEEMLRDVEDERPWDQDGRFELVERLRSILDMPEQRRKC